MNVQLKQQEARGFEDREILGKIRQLNPQEIAEVVDFIDFLLARQPERHPLVQLLTEAKGDEIGLDALRDRLTKISGTMAEAVQEGRDERG